jgi:hypothetical protein
MPTGTGRGGGRGGNDYPQENSGRGGASGRGRGGAQQGERDPYDFDENGNRIRVKVGVAWINGDKAGPYLPDMLTDQIYLRFSLDDFEEIPDGWRIFGFPNKNKKGKAPDIDFVALPPKEENAQGGGRGGY